MGKIQVQRCMRTEENRFLIEKSAWKTEQATESLPFYTKILF